MNVKRPKTKHVTPKQLRKTITNWFTQTYCARLMVGDPMKDSEVELFKKKINKKLPSDVLRCIAEFGGKIPRNPRNEPADGIIPGNFSKDFSSFGAFCFLPFRAILHEHNTFIEFENSGEFADEKVKVATGVKPLFLSSDWIPFAANGLGDSLCVDLNPDSGGTKGQVVCFFHESNKRPKLAETIGEFFTKLKTEYDENRFYVTDDNYELRKMRFQDFPILYF